MRSWFFTATDTGIGKTTVTAASALALKSAGVDVGVMKPFATGIKQDGKFRSSDVELLVGASGVADSEDLINPVFFPLESSPYGAAAKLGTSIEPDIVIERFERLQSLHDLVLVEGIGGVLTPILKDYFVADMAREMGLDVIVVASSRLGTVNHTLLTCNACKERGLNVRGIVINHAGGGYEIDDLKRDLTNLTGIDTVCVLPYVKDYDISKLADVVASSNLLEMLMS